MPMRIGFTNFRQQMLERELDRIIETMPILGVEKAILVGDMITGKYSPDSRIDLIIVHQTDRSFGRRADFFSYHLNSSVAVGTQVYTPEEFEALQETHPTLKRAVEKGRVIFNA